MASRKSLRSCDIPADDVVVRQSDNNTVVSAKSKTSGKSSDSNMRSCRLSMHLWSFLRGSKPVSPMASTVLMVGPSTSTERDARLPEQRSNVSLFGPGNVQPQTVCENVFGAYGDARLQNQSFSEWQVLRYSC